MLIATASTGTFDDVKKLGCRLLQRYSKSRGGGFVSKEMVRFNLDPSSSKVSSSNASVLFKLYRREQAATPNGALPPGWIFNTIGDCLQAKNVDDCVPAAQVNLRDIVPTVSVRGQCGPDVEYYYKSIEKFSHHGNKYAKIEVWEDVAKVCLVEERSSKVRILDWKTGKIQNVICV
ncbi:hypothetical protein TrRE_jg10025, partial [Triparma retinervis]